MCRKRVVWLALLCTVSATAAAQNLNFLLDIKYSERITPGPLFGFYTVADGTDSAGNIYILASGYLQGGSFACSVSKLNPTGQQVIYQTQLTFYANAMAVDPAGYVYLSGVDQSMNATIEKVEYGWLDRRLPIELGERT